jgi:competence protein ComEC
MGLMLRAFQFCVLGLHGLPGASLYLIPLGWLGGGALYLLLLAGLRWAKHGRPWGIALVSTIALALVLGLGLPRPSTLEITVLSVGQGDATAIRTPHGRWLLIDAGPSWEGGDAGERTILPFLRRQGATRLAGLVVTHSHVDHLGGAGTILAALPCEEVLENGEASREPAHHGLFAAMLRHRVPWRSAQGGQTLCLEPGLFLDVLAPDQPLLSGTRSDPNNNSVVLRLRYGAFKMLFVGDVEHEAEARLVRAHPAGLDATLLKAAHHGSRYGSSAPFLDAVGPRASIVSVGARNTFQHPAPEAIARLRRYGPVYRTDQDGAVTVRTDGRTYRIETVRGAHASGDRSLEASVPVAEGG